MENTEAKKPIDSTEETEEMEIVVEMSEMDGFPETDTFQDDSDLVSEFIFEQPRSLFYQEGTEWQNKLFGKKTGPVYDVQKVELFLEKIAIKAKKIETEITHLKKENHLLTNLIGDADKVEENEDVLNKWQEYNEKQKEIDGLIETHREILKDAASQKEKILRNAREEAEEIKRRSMRSAELELRNLNTQIAEKMKIVTHIKEQESVLKGEISHTVDVMEMELMNRMGKVMQNVKAKIQETEELETDQTDEQIEA